MMELTISSNDTSVQTPHRGNPPISAAQRRLRRRTRKGLKRNNSFFFILWEKSIRAEEEV
ncbi:hypothetical protein ACER0C_005816 [Sarotherodon galilaeus]